MGCGTSSNVADTQKKPKEEEKKQQKEEKKPKEDKETDKDKEKDQEKKDKKKDKEKENKKAQGNKVKPSDEEKQMQKDYKKTLEKKQKEKLEFFQSIAQQDAQADLEKVDQETIDQLIDAIDNEDYEGFCRIIDEHTELYPNFQIKIDWLFLHYLCLEQEYKMLDYVLKQAYKRCNKDDDKFKKLLNSTQIGTNETPLMIASKVNAPNCVLVLLKIGGIDATLKNYDDETAFKKKHPSYKLLKSAKKIDLNIEYLESDPIQDIKELGYEIKEEKQEQQQSEDKIQKIPYSIDQSLTKYQGDQHKMIYKFQKELLEKHKKQNTNFIDPDFPHELSSITVNEFEKYSYQNVIWLRAKDIFKKEKTQIKLFDTIEPNDIKQGPLGVCYLLSTLAGLAEFPDRVVRLFNIREYNEQGIYSVTFYKLGRPFEIIVDDYFPCNSSTHKLLFAQPNGPELWAILLEKAWAKLFGNYTVAESMSVSESMQQILGCPSEYFPIAEQNPKELQQKLQKYDDKKYIINATSFPEGNKEMGIVGSHAYSIISVYTLDDLFLMKVRNPWGNHELKNGKYSDDSSNWTEDLKKKVDFKNEDDGIFFITYEEFASLFRFVSIAFYLDDYKYFQRLITKAVPTHQEIKPSCWEFTIEKQQDVNFRVHQLYERYFAKEDHEYEQTEVFLFDEKFKFLEVGTVSGCAFGSHAVPFANQAMINLQPGKYYLTTKVKFRDTSKPNEYTLSAYAQSDATLNEITTPNFYSELLQRAVIATFRDADACFIQCINSIFKGNYYGIASVFKNLWEDHFQQFI